MKYTIRNLIKRNEDTWEASFYHRDPITNERVPTYHTIKAKSKQAAERARDELRYELESKGTIAASSTTVSELLQSYIKYKDESGTIEKSTVKDYSLQNMINYSARSILPNAMERSRRSEKSLAELRRPKTMTNSIAMMA